MPVTEVAKARQQFGQMYSVADKIELALNKERYAENRVANAPLKASDVSLLGGTAFVFDRAQRAFFGKPADRSVRSLKK